MSFPRYPKYKENGVEWLGQVPEHWEVKPLKYATTHNDEVLDEGTPADQEIAYIDISGVDAVAGIAPPAIIQFGEAPSRARRRVKDGDVIVSTVRTYLRAIARIQHPPENLIVSTGFAVVRAMDNSHSGFVGFLMKAGFFIENVIARSTGVSYPAINASELVRIEIPLPPLHEQAAIADFLDRETAKIDGLIAEQERLIELLKEKRQAVISHAVTKGLNPNVPMKDSGIEWLGKVPEHWSVGPIKRVIEAVESGTSVNATDEPAEEGQLGVLKTSCVYTGKFRPEENKTVVVEENGRVSCPLKAGALIVSRMNTPDLVGAAGYVQFAAENIFLPDRLWQILVKDSEARFVHYWTLTVNYRAQVEAACTGTSSSMKNLGQDQFGMFSFAVPPLSEQATIIDFLDQESFKLDTLTTEAQKAITLLQERRSALISAAVTGQIDVRRIHKQAA